MALGQARGPFRGHGQCRAGIVGGEEHADFLEDLAHRGDPQADGFFGCESGADDLARLFGRTAHHAGDHCRAAIFLAHGAAGIAVHAAQKWHAVGPAGEKYFEAAGLDRTQENHGRGLFGLARLAHRIAKLTGPINLF